MAEASWNVAGQEIRVRGGLVRIARLAADKFDSAHDPEGMREALAQSGLRVDLFTFMQLPADPTPRYAYPMEWDNLAAVPVSTFDHWWTSQIDSRTRNHVRVAEKKRVVVREVPYDDALVRGISAVYDESPVRQGKPFWHHGKDLETVRRENGTFAERSIFIGAFLDEALIGFAKLVCDRDRTQAGLMQIVSMIRHRDKAPTNALIAEAVRSCAARQIRHLVYSTLFYGRKRDGLSAFKEHNGFQPVALPRYYLPLTRAGRAALRLGLHHPFSRRIPEPLLAQLRRARSLWYERRLQSQDGMNAF